MKLRKKAATSFHRPAQAPTSVYEKFQEIDGKHPLRKAVPGGYLDYQARTRHGGKVAYFNYALAKEMGLIPDKHPHELNPNLEKALLEAFSLTIVNEYDILHQTPIPEEDLRPNTYMATRYLQLQHPDKTGHTSGDGRSIWNGYFKGKRGEMWDISSCGTGATCLSPATAIEGKFFKTGDPKVSYGCGYADFSDGVAAVLLSETFHRNGIKTERTLAIIEFEKGLSINVRAYKNLLRPSHLFYHLKQGNYEGLKGAVDYFIERQMKNGEFPTHLKDKKAYEHLLWWEMKCFAEATAQFESEYIFCWLDWDGDNILADGGIIDYGSVRQFGLYHHEYRYDDVERMSTTIPEQKLKAKYILQTYAQLVDFLITKKKKNIKNFASHPILKEFDKHFSDTLDKLLVYKLGFSDKEQQHLLKHHRKTVRDFRKVFNYFEKAKAKRGLYKVVDGITWDAIFCMRDILRELPRMYLAGQKWIRPEEFIEIVRSRYAKNEDLKLTPFKRYQIKKFQKLYWKLLKAACANRDTQKVLLPLSMRSSLINRADRITGDAVLHVSFELIKRKKRLETKELNDIIEDFVQNQTLRPEYFTEASPAFQPFRAHDDGPRKVLGRILELVRTHRQGI